MKKILAITWLCLSALTSFAQSSPNLYYGQIPTPSQWNGYFATKQDYAGPINGSSIGSTTPSTGAFTTLSATGPTNLSSGLTVGGTIVATGITGTPISGSTGSFTTLSATGITGTPISGSTGAFTSLSATGTVTSSAATDGFLTDATNGYILFSGDHANYNLSRSGTSVNLKSAGNINLVISGTGVLTVGASGVAVSALTTTGTATIGGNASINGLNVGKGGATTNTHNTVFGTSAATTTTGGQYLVAFGDSALGSGTGSFNTAIGSQAGNALTTGTANTLVGTQAGNALTTGSGNTFVGGYGGTGGPGYYVTTGSNNTILGGYNGNQGGLDIRTLSNYTVLSDGVGNVRAYHDGSNWILSGAVNSPNLHTSASGTAPAAGGTGGAAYMMSSTANLGIYFGSGAPTISAAQGSLYMRTDGSSTSTRMYVNTNGSTTWTNLVTGL